MNVNALHDRRMSLSGENGRVRAPAMHGKCADDPCHAERSGPRRDPPHATAPPGCRPLALNRRDRASEKPRPTAASPEPCSTPPSSHSLYALPVSKWTTPNATGDWRASSGATSPPSSIARRLTAARFACSTRPCPSQCATCPFPGDSSPAAPSASTSRGIPTHAHKPPHHRLALRCRKLPCHPPHREPQASGDRPEPSWKGYIDHCT